MPPHIFSKSILITFCIIFSFISIYFFNFTDLKNLKFNWDETDYANVTSKGFIANYTDDESLSIKQFVYIGKQKFLNKNFEQRIINEFINEEDDNFNLRHYHPPIPIYYWSFFITDEDSVLKINNNLRVSMLILYLILFYYFIYIIYSKIKNNLSRLFISLVILIGFFTNSIVINGFLNLQFHVFYSLVLIFHIQSLLNLYLKKINYFLIFNFVFSTSLLLLTLHTSLISLFASLLSLIYLNKFFKNKISALRIIKYFTSSILLAIILFPPFITKAYYVKIFLTYVYKLIILRGSEFSMYGSAFNKWINYFTENNYILIIPLICIFSAQLFLKKENRYINIFLIHSFTYSIFITPFFVSFTYILPSLMCLIIFTLYYVFLSNSVNKKIWRNSIFFLSIGIIIFNFNFLKNGSYKDYFSIYNERIQNIENLISIHKNKKFLIDGAHIMKFYTKNKNIDELSILSRNSPDFFIRKEYNYVSINNEIINNFYDFIIIQENRNFSDSQYSFLLNNNYEIIKKNAYDIFQLKK